MKKSHHLTGFYAEALLLAAAFIAVILILTRVFAAAERKSLQASYLTHGVTLAESTAEAFSAAGDAESLCALLNESGNASLSGGTVTASYSADLLPDPDGIYTVTAVTAEKDDITGCTITVSVGETEVYILTTAAYSGEEAAR